MTSELTDPENAPVTSGPAPETALGAKAYFFASAWAQICSLLRYMIMARLLGPQQLGLAATLVLTQQFFEMMAESGADRFLIQNKDGDSPDAQNFVQLIFVLRGMLVAFLLVVMAWPMSALYKEPPLLLGFVLLAFTPLINGFFHLDTRRLQRHNDFRSEASALWLSEFSSLIVAVIAAWMIRSFVAILLGMITRSIVFVLVTHLTAKRKWGLKYSPQFVKELARFSLPLLANGLLLFFSSQGDRVVVGGQMGIAMLGRYSAVLLLIYAPAGALSRFIETIHLPKIAKERDNPVGARLATDRLAGQTVLLGVMMAAGFAVVGPVATVILYGLKFQQPALIVALIGVLQSMRFVRLWPSTISLATARPELLIFNNIGRLTGVPLAILAYHLGYGIVGILAGLIAGEFIGLGTILILLNIFLPRRPLADLDRFLLTASASASLIGMTLAVRSGSLQVLAGVGALVFLAALLMARREKLVVGETWRQIERLFAGVRKRTSPATSKIAD